MENTKMKSNSFIPLFATLILGIFSCDQSDKKFLDNPAMGEITLAVDESFTPLVKAEKKAFEGIKKNTKINLKEMPENEAVADLLNNKVRGIVISRDLDAKEMQTFNLDKINYRSFKFALDGIALITSKKNKDTLLSVQNLSKIMTGELTQWKQLGARTVQGEIFLVVDKGNSSNLRFLLDKFKINQLSKLRIYEAGSNVGVIDYVKNTPNAIGLIGSNWVSDGDNPQSLGFIRSVNVISVTEKANPKPEDYYQPFGYNLALKLYPLRREIKIILKEGHMGLGTGFVNYMTGDMGQLIVLKFGLIPLTRPINIRQYQIN